MDTKRKIQLSAVAVMANGLLALGVMNPGPAQATSCGSYYFCDVCLLDGCQAVAPPGCKAVGATPWGPGPCGFSWHCETTMLTLCDYAPV
jgi:hypothetical protein